MTNELPARNATYQFGDSLLAAERLHRLAEVFEPSTRALLARLPAGGVRKIADLGCGPGHTTRLLAEIFASAQVTGFDISPNFIERARQDSGGRLQFVTADVTETLPDGPYDVLYCRYVLTHLAEPLAAVGTFGAQLQPRGMLVIEENQWIRTEQPAFARYLEIVTAMLADANQRLYVGAELAAATFPGLVPLSSEVTPLAVADRAAARMFLPNLETWRTRPFVAQNYTGAELDRLQTELQQLADARANERSITFGLRQIVLASAGPGLAS
ncbi:MAG: trans-aconitate 2-methyltransferase [Pirellulales bacterium]